MNMKNSTDLSLVGHGRAGLGALAVVRVVNMDALSLVNVSVVMEDAGPGVGVLGPAAVIALVAVGCLVWRVMGRSHWDRFWSHSVGARVKTVETFSDSLVGCFSVCRSSGRARGADGEAEVAHLVGVAPPPAPAGQDAEERLAWAISHKDWAVRYPDLAGRSEWTVENDFLEAVKTTKGLLTPDSADFEDARVLAELEGACAFLALALRKTSDWFAFETTDKIVRRPDVPSVLRPAPGEQQKKQKKPRRGSDDDDDDHDDHDGGGDGDNGYSSEGTYSTDHFDDYSLPSDNGEDGDRRKRKAVAAAEDLILNPARSLMSWMGLGAKAPDGDDEGDGESADIPQRPTGPPPPPLHKLVAPPLHSSLVVGAEGTVDDDNGSSSSSSSSGGSGSRKASSSSRPRKHALEDLLVSPRASTASGLLSARLRGPPLLKLAHVVENEEDAEAERATGLPPSEGGGGVEFGHFPIMGAHFVETRAQLERDLGRLGDDLALLAELVVLRPRAGGFQALRREGLKKLAARIVQQTRATMLHIQFADMVNADAARKMVVASTLEGEVLNRGRVLRHINAQLRTLMLARKLRLVLLKGALELLSVDKLRAEHVRFLALNLDRKVLDDMQQEGGEAREVKARGSKRPASAGAGSKPGRTVSSSSRISEGLLENLRLALPKPLNERLDQHKARRRALKRLARSGGQSYGRSGDSEGDRSAAYTRFLEYVATRVGRRTAAKLANTAAASSGRGIGPATLDDLLAADKLIESTTHILTTLYTKFLVAMGGELPHVPTSLHMRLAARIVFSLKRCIRDGEEYGRESLEKLSEAVEEFAREVELTVSRLKDACVLSERARHGYIAVVRLCVEFFPIYQALVDAVVYVGKNFERIAEAAEADELYTPPLTETRAAGIELGRSMLARLRRAAAASSLDEAILPIIRKYIPPVTSVPSIVQDVANGFVVGQFEPDFELEARLKNRGAQKRYVNMFHGGYESFSPDFNPTFLSVFQSLWLAALSFTPAADGLRTDPKNAATATAPSSSKKYSAGDGAEAEDGDQQEEEELLGKQRGDGGNLGAARVAQISGYMFLVLMAAVRVGLLFVRLVLDVALVHWMLRGLPFIHVVPESAILARFGVDTAPPLFALPAARTALSRLFDLSRTADVALMSSCASAANLLNPVLMALGVALAIASVHHNVLLTVSNTLRWVRGGGGAQGPVERGTGLWAKISGLAVWVVLFVLQVVCGALARVVQRFGRSAGAALVSLADDSALPGRWASVGRCSTGDDALARVTFRAGVALCAVVAAVAVLFFGGRTMVSWFEDDASDLMAERDDEPEQGSGGRWHPFGRRHFVVPRGSALHSESDNLVARLISRALRFVWWLALAAGRLVLLTFGLWTDGLLLSMEVLKRAYIFNNADRANPDNRHAEVIRLVGLSHSVVWMTLPYGALLAKVMEAASDPPVFVLAKHEPSPWQEDWQFTCINYKKNRDDKFDFRHELDDLKVKDAVGRAEVGGDEGEGEGKGEGGGGGEGEGGGGGESAGSGSDEDGELAFSVSVDEEEVAAGKSREARRRAAAVREAHRVPKEILIMKAMGPLNLQRAWFSRLLSWLCGFLRVISLAGILWLDSALPYSIFELALAADFVLGLLVDAGRGANTLRGALEPKGNPVARRRAARLAEKRETISFSFEAMTRHQGPTPPGSWSYPRNMFKKM